MSDCRKYYENAYPAEVRTSANWHCWKRAWNAALLVAANSVNSQKV